VARGYEFATRLSMAVARRTHTNGGRTSAVRRPPVVKGTSVTRFEQDVVEYAAHNADVAGATRHRPRDFVVRLAWPKV